MKIKTISVIIVCLLGVLFTLPNFMSLSKNYNSIWVPQKTIRLGLDLRGGISVLLGMDGSKLIESEVQNLDKQINQNIMEWGLSDKYKTEIKDRNIKVLSVISAETFDTAKSNEKSNEKDLTTIIELEKRLKQKLKSIYGVGVEFLQAKNSLEVSFSKRRLDEILERALDQNIEIVRRRVDETGINEPSIQRFGKDRILVQLPGVDDPQRIKNLLGQTAQLNFHYLYDGNEKDALARGYRSVPDIKNPDQTHLVSKYVQVPGEYLSSAGVTYDNGLPAVSLSFNDVGARRFSEATREVGKFLAIVLDDKVISTPRVTKMILDGQAIIKGNMTLEEARDLAVLLKSGALPAPMEILEEKIVGPDLGEGAIDTGITSGIVAMIVVVLIMISIYGAFGVFTSLSLLINMSLVLGALSFLQATLTLPGVAGIVLTIGMAVDANVIIFERIKEERLNQPILPMIRAIEMGFDRSFQSIFDANLTTILAGAILFWLGSGAVKGFAVTLILGVISSMFTSTVVNRMLLTSFYRLLRYHRTEGR